MAYLTKIETTPVDSLRVDAYGRQKFSLPFGQFNTKFNVGTSPTMESELTGGGTVAHNANESTMDLTVTNPGDKVVFQSEFVAYEQPGKGIIFLAIGKLINDIDNENVRSRIGAFDGNDGIFFEYYNGLRIVKRDSLLGSVSETVYEQSEWNIDKMDGNPGSLSGIVLQADKMQVFCIDWQLFVGRIRIGLFIDGIPYYVHEINTANVAVTNFMSNINLPVRFEIEQFGSVPCTMKVSGQSVDSDGGYKLARRYYPSYSGFVNIPSGVETPVLAIRASTPRAGINPAFIDFLYNGFADKSFLVKLIYNPVITGGSWSLNGPRSEINTTMSAFSGGREKAAFFVGKGVSQKDKDVLDYVFTGAKVNGERKPLLVTVTNLGVGTANDVRLLLEYQELH